MHNAAKFTSMVVPNRERLNKLHPKPVVQFRHIKVNTSRMLIRWPGNHQFKLMKAVC